MFKVGDKGKTRGGWGYVVTGTRGDDRLIVRVERVNGFIYDFEGKAAGLKDFYDLLPGTNDEVKYNPARHQAVKDFALHFIETYNPANAADIATAALEFAGDDE